MTADPRSMLVLVVVAALVFDYINGFHDAANAVATVVSTGVLPLRTAILLAAALNFWRRLHRHGRRRDDRQGARRAGAPSRRSWSCRRCSGAIVWNLVTWYFGIPSSSSHALVGGLVGAALAHAGPAVDPGRRAAQGRQEPGRQPAGRASRSGSR